MRMPIVVSAVFVIGLLSAGCEKSTPSGTTAPGTNQAGEQSGVIGTMLQYDTLKAGRRAQEKARQAAAANNERVKEAIPVD